MDIYAYITKQIKRERGARTTHSLISYVFNMFNSHVVPKNKKAHMYICYFQNDILTIEIGMHNLFFFWTEHQPSIHELIHSIFHTFFKMKN